MELTAALPDVVRSVIAHAVLGPAQEDATLGSLRLHAHQVAGVERVRRIMHQRGGALLSDDVGLGKTYVALCVARDEPDTLVVAPAALRATWIAAAARAHVRVRFASLEQLSRGGPLPMAAPLVIVDEAHHLRNPGTRRFLAVATLCREARVLLLSATPVQNRDADLRVLLSLFLGERAHGASVPELAECVVRRTEAEATAPSAPLPVLDEPQWIQSPADVDCLDRILAMPSPLPPSDGEDGGILLTWSLVRQWASSRAALVRALRRRLGVARAMEDALLAGRMPTRRELATWCQVDGVQQLGFPEIQVHGVHPDATALLPQVLAHADAVRELLAWLRASPDPDAARAGALRRVRAAHPGERIVAFTEFSETVAALFRELRGDGHVAALTHAGGTVAGGRLARQELLERFAAPPGRVRDAERVDVLLTTDVLSEGVNLQAASVVVHLDLAWNPARLTQRVGRLRRLGAARPRIAVYLVQPPAPAERFLRMEDRLRAKLGAAARSVGVAGTILPGDSRAEAASAAATSAAAREERIVQALSDWRRPETLAPDGPVVAAVRSGTHGAIACLARDGGAWLVVEREGRVTDDRDAVLAMLPCAVGAAQPLSAAAARATAARIERWVQGRMASGVVDLASLRVGRSRAAVLRRVDGIARRAARHDQPRLAPLLSSARVTASVTLAAGAERVLDQLARADLADDAWLRAVGEFGALHARPPGGPARIVALLLVGPGD